MADKSKMPPELLAHFKKKAEGKEDSSQSPEQKKEDDKTRRKEAVKKARIRMEEKNRGAGRDQKEKAGKAGS
jgi:hypothetical protein